MRNVLKSILLVILFISVVKAEEGKHYGKKITLTEKTKVSDILASPEKFVGKKVLIEGTVVDVCKKRGCWIKVAADEGYGTIRVKVNDGEIVFPLEAKGKTALVEGEVYSFVVKEEGCGGDCEKEGDHKDGEKCEHEKTEKTIYQIKGIGAIIK